MTRQIYCCRCSVEVLARLTDGSEIYPHRSDLHSLPFWKCDACGNYVGCHHKTPDRTRPLGCIPTDEIKLARLQIHAVIDPLWKSGKMPRGKVYSRLHGLLGKPFHSAEIRSVDEAFEALLAAKEVVRAARQK